MKIALIIIKTTPTASTACSRDGGSTKLGGLPSGLTASGTFDKLVMVKAESMDRML
jgi:hypothetical protein